jgi:hypothetical protein
MVQPVQLFRRESSDAIGFIQAKDTVKAAIELGLFVASGAVITLKSTTDRPTRDLVLDGLDHEVLTKIDVEPYFSLFFSYLLGLNREGTFQRSPQAWANEFNRDAFNDRRPSNPFNAAKYTGLQRWFSYAGLGWFDSEGVFQCNPFYRLTRQLSRIFGDERKISGEAFIKAVGTSCPELDNGSLFLKANPRYDASARICTLGLAHALIDLHEDRWIRLHCPRDSGGWSLELAQPPSDGKTLLSGKIQFVELLRTPK